MALVQSQAILEQLQHARSANERIVALQALKNDTVGHVLKKTKWVELGVLRPIVRCILLGRPASRADSRRLSTGAADGLSHADLSRLQALELLGVFASGGPSFLPPLHAAGALPAILSCIDPQTTPPRLVYAALRAIATMAKTAALVDLVPSAAPPPITTAELANALFSGHHLAALHSILAPRPPQTLPPPQQFWADSIANVAIALIGLLCREERHQAALANAGALDDLAVKVASLVVAGGLVVPGAETAAEKEGLREAIPPPASPRLDAAALLSAVTAVLGDSRLRACTLLYAPAILAIFPQLEFDGAAHDIYAAWNALCMGGLSNLHDQPLGALDLLLPAIPSQQSRSYFAQNSPFPPLGISLSRDNLAALGLGGSTGKRSGSHSQPRPSWGRDGAGGAAAGAAAESAAQQLSPLPQPSEWESADAESPMVPWLLGLVRSSSGLQRLAAASVLTSLFRAQLTSKSREAAMALLVVPLLLRMLADASAANTTTLDDAVLFKQRASTETALAVLARLIANREVLQKAAVDCNATAILAKLLKESYEPTPLRSTLRPWNPTPPASRIATPERRLKGSDDDDSEGMEDQEELEELDGDNSLDPLGPQTVHASRPGPAGLDELLAYRIRLRGAVLRAITALISSKYEYQKRFVEQEAMPYVLASLSPTPSKPRAAKEKTKAAQDSDAAAAGSDQVDPEYGRNPTDVMVAACNCLRMLSRSAAILRTTLQDAELVEPVMLLLRHPEMEVKNAATAVACNLVTDTSPMREEFVEAGMMAILCSHAHSHNSSLRLNALWALKHLVDGFEPDRKKACLEQLGSGWLVRLIDPDMDEEESPFAWAKSEGRTATSSGKMAELYGSEDVVMDAEEDERAVSKEDQEDVQSIENAAWSATSTLQRARFPRMSHERSRTGRLREAEARLAALRETEQAQVRRGHSDDVEIQEQGLNFIRNLMGPGPTAMDSTRDVLQETTGMIDYLFSELGQDRLFQILLSKLRPRVVRRSGSGLASMATSMIVHPHSKIVEAVVFLLVHVSASVPRHRQVVMAHTELLKALVAQFSSRNKGVRLALCHLLSNLTWQEDTDDTAVVTRRLELKRLGMLTKLQRLQAEDGDLDVREQAKMAIHQLR